MSGLADLGATTCGVWTRARALAVTTRGHVDALLSRGEWQSPRPGVYADGGVVLEVDQRGFAAVLVSGGQHEPITTSAGKKVLKAVVCGRLAARLHGFPLVDDDDPATGRGEFLLDDVAVPWAGVPLRSPTADGRERVLTRHRRRYGRQDLTRLPSGLYVTSYPRTLLDCAQLLRPDALVCVLDDALHRELVTEQELAALVQQRSWLAGVVGLREAMALADGRAESPNETLVRLILKPHLPGLVPQHRLRDDGGRVLARFDLGDPRLRLAVEADGTAAHAGPRMAARDQRRDRVSDTWGWRTERCTWFQARCRQSALVRRMLEAARDQARRHSLA